MTGYPKNSKVEITLRDGTTMQDTAWSTISERKVVRYLDQNKTVYVCTLPIASVKIWLDDLSAEVEASEGDEVYIAIRSEMFAAQNVMTDTVVGKTVGVVRNGEIIEEKYINARESRVEGFRK